MSRVGQARALLANLITELRAVGKLEGDKADGRLDAAIAALDLHLEEGDVTHDGTLPEWANGWPRGTWVDSFGFVFEVGMTARDSEGSLMYLVPAGLIASAPGRWAIYASTVSEARTKDGRIFRRIV